MTHEDVPPRRAKDLVDEGWTYVDVRSVEEFESGHPEGAYNVPIAHAGAGGMEPNPDFAAVMERLFPPDAKLVLGCAMGGRSARACELLASRGYGNLVNVVGGFSGARDATGRVVEPGWAECDLPTSTGAPSGRSWHELSG